jgi:ABC-type antimicrobial peptide transport system permease subunit
MAMGAQRIEVLHLVLPETMLFVALGLAIGIAAAAAAGRLVASQLFGIEPTDPVTMVSAILVMLAVSAAAGCQPAVPPASIR